ncbi:MAG: LysM peptidoglycan-binding domain-containing protein [Bacteroidetes bacterium]|nr:LysM peptidoglycan-binding domain-containing protein [Bacteroidota bacterium]
MKHLKYSTTFFITALILTSCGSKKKSIQSTQSYQTKTNVAVTEESKVYDAVGQVKKPPKNLSQTESYIYQYAEIAKQEMKLFGIPASITLAQGILESGNGQGQLTSRSNNHFGIKCNGWKGAKVYHDDDKDQECFRKYTHAEYSYRDHSLFLFNRSRYAFLFDYDARDYKAWAKGLKKAGYATDPKYPKKLINLIERYDLNKYDDEVFKSRKNKHKKKRRNLPKENYHHVKKGDTLYSISNRYGISVEDLKKLNNLRGNDIQIGQQLKLK